jgi:alpha-ketoglutaric semialdehyde dehydrogenase
MNTMGLTGKQWIGGEWSAEGMQKFAATNPATAEQLAPEFIEATLTEADRALKLADEAFASLQTASTEIIATLLDEIAFGLEKAGDELLNRVQSETALPRARVEGECARTINQTRMFATLVRDGSWQQPRIDRGNPDRKPLPKPDVRTMLLGVGPVVVFGASNFPLAISVAGTDTIAAFAARCPVVVKAHPGHPGTCEMIAQIIGSAVEKVGLPPGTFSLLQGAGHEIGVALVEHPLTAAVAFTGSQRGGRALFDAAASRPKPIPVYAEMGSTNPVFVLPGAAQERAEQIAALYVQSVTMGVGQFCTNPGLLFIEEGDAHQRFSQSVVQAAEQSTPATMLHAGIHSAFQSGVKYLADLPGVEVLARSTTPASESSCQAACTIFKAPADLIAEHPELTEEVFGPESIVFSCREVSQMLHFARGMEGHLTATIHGTERDLLENAELVRILERKVGRIVFNGFPTGIEVCTAIHHGGPYPATTHSHFTSIGPFAIYRFTKPVCFQGFPDAALPELLRNANPNSVPRIVDGKLSTESL